MLYKVHIVDAETGKPLPQATIRIFEADGSDLETGQANAEGDYFLDSEGLGNQRGQFMEVTAPGYNFSYQELPLYLGTGTAFVIQVWRKEIPWLLIGAGGVGALWLISSQKKKKVGAFDVKPYLPFVPPLIGITLIGVVVYKVGQKFGLFDDEEDKRRKQEAEGREQDYQQSMEEICRLDPSTGSDASWITTCDKIEKGLDYAGYLQAYADDVVYNLSKAQNDCDVQKLIYFFGHRELRDWLLIKGGDYTLGQGILERLSPEDVNAVNSDYEQKGIQYRW